MGLFSTHAQEYCSGRTYDKRIAEAILPTPMPLQTSLFISAITRYLKEE